MMFFCCILFMNLCTTTLVPRGRRGPYPASEKGTQTSYRIVLARYRSVSCACLSESCPNTSAFSPACAHTCTKRRRRSARAHNVIDHTTTCSGSRPPAPQHVVCAPHRIPATRHTAHHALHWRRTITTHVTQFASQCDNLRHYSRFVPTISLCNQSSNLGMIDALFYVEVTNMVNSKKTRIQIIYSMKDRAPYCLIPSKHPAMRTSNWRLPILPA